MKTTLYLHKMDETAHSTVSSLFALDPDDDSVRKVFLGFIIEDGYNEVKIPGETRIPAGLYSLRKKKDGEFLAKYKSLYGHEWIPEVMGVPGYSAILIHIGNFIRDTRGCLLPNKSIQYNAANDTFYGTDSGSTYRALYAYLDSVWGDDDEVWIDVRR